MKISCIAFDEEQNILTLELDDEAKQFLLEHAVNSLLIKALNELEKNGGIEVSGVQGDCAATEPRGV